MAIVIVVVVMLTVVVPMGLVALWLQIWVSILRRHEVIPPPGQSGPRWSSSLASCLAGWARPGLAWRSDSCSRLRLQRRSACCSTCNPSTLYCEHQVCLLLQLLGHESRVATDAIYFNDAVARRNAIIWILLIVLLDEPSVLHTRDNQGPPVGVINIYAQGLGVILFVNACCKYSWRIRVQRLLQRILLLAPDQVLHLAHDALHL
mmetsp:Transcript_1847/g.4667  ORF Transcript_1847/g.4667 Transcript_1847/m.4667 type:complete len:205 (+) Transcript_1847:757-1371(+)